MLVAVIDELLQGWDEFTAAGGNRLNPRQNKTYPGAAIVLSLSTHVHESVRMIRPAMPDQLTVIHSPTIRTVLECAHMVIWVDREPEAASGLMLEEARSRRNLRDSLQEASSLTQYAERIGMTEVSVPNPDAPATALARRFDQLAKALGAQDFYAAYRLLSAQSHASVMLTDEYLIASDDHPFELRTTADPVAGTLLHTWICAACLVWTGRCVDYLDKRNLRRSELRRAVNQLAIPAEWPTTH